jgi:hypothetical protein
MISEKTFQKKIIILYLIMLVGHLAHIFEEIWGRFWILNKIGLGLFLMINWGLFCIPVILLYFVMNNKRWAYKLGIVCAAFMALQGIGHNLGTIITGKYFDGFAGGFSGIFLLIIGLPLVYYLWKMTFQNN